jgi:glycosyltransferase involved in cell wall biosynthesis
MKIINVLHIIGGLNVGGAEKSLYLLLKHINKEQFSPVVVTMFSDTKNDFFYQDFVKLKIPVYSLKLKSWRDIKTFRQFRQIIKKHRIDISHSHYGLLEFYGPLFSKLAGVKKCIYTKHNIRQKTGLVFQIQRIVLNKLLVSKILSISDSVTDYITENEFAGRNKIALIYNPINIPDVNKIDKSILKKQFNIPSDRFIIGNTNRYDSWKGFDIFYSVISTLFKNGQNIHALVMGSGDNRRIQEELIEKYGLADSVTIIPFQKDMDKIYPMLDCFVITSKHTEGFGMAMVEALAWGIPVVGLNIGCIPEIILNNKTGLVPFPLKKQLRLEINQEKPAAQYLANAILSLIHDEKTHSQLGKNARLFAKQFDAKIFTEKIENIYLELTRKQIP